ncbi:DUF4350 domain-containing protein [Leeuwenhoekiella sp. MAR_2009_132]|uniref:DUF4350 domain-containing protein n=1 Tax=Leeuwenhoekiella sp. MAR_2009_132 TaxID=1392489 RepID=UPI00048DA956|nr:DUF4350 domain-containing protein [Leeuwenhoekiella sp. MAR_2009_132]
MTTRYKILAGILILCVALLIAAEASKPEPINWFPAYGKLDKIPFGTYVFYDQLNTVIDEERIQEVNVPPFEFLLDSTVSGTYFFLNSSVYNDEAEANKLLNWVAKGNTLFIAANAVSETILDTLNLNTSYYTETEVLEKRPVVYLSNPKLNIKTAYLLDKDISTVFFDEIDTLQTTVLGVFHLANSTRNKLLPKPKINFIKTPYKKGTVIINTFPEAYTNVFMLDSINAEYTAKTLAYLPAEGNLYLDQHYKNSKAVAVSPLFIILNNKYLKWSWYTLLITALIWVYFEGKRNQRSIAVIKPLSNKTLDYTRTIAGMYLDKKDNRQIAMHQINHFMEYIRSTFILATDKKDLAFIENLAAKSNVSVVEIKNTIDYIISLKQKAEITEDELIQLNTYIENFKKHHQDGRIN